MRDIVQKSELYQASTKEIRRRSRLYDNSPLMTIPIVEQLGYDGMTNFGETILLETGMGQDRVNQHTRTFLRQLKYLSGTPPEKASPLLWKTISERSGASKKLPPLVHQVLPLPWPRQMHYTLNWWKSAGGYSISPGAQGTPQIDTSEGQKFLFTRIMMI